MSSDANQSTLHKLISANIGWIGAGKMGAPMARNLLSAGYKLKVCEPNKKALQELQHHGAEDALNLSDLHDADIVFSTLPNDAALDLVLNGTENQTGLARILQPGACLIEMSTVSPECSAATSAVLHNKGVHYLRAPLSGSTKMAESATLTVLASGDEAAWVAALPLLKSLSASQFYLGSGDEARYMKLVLNTLVGGAAGLLAEAMALGKAGGLDAARMMSVINESAVASPLLKYKTEAISKSDFAPAFSVEQMIKDVSLITDAGQSHDIPMKLMELLLGQYQAASQAGFGQQDFFSLIAWMTNERTG
ncbi:MAG: NAD(P)-dependent oxidoreductase [Yoonia sp.]|uniref:NAD(P)-dependent oxidoreductase n=1 Tax=Yoonia sp. TaxID=2212373 RepID=UPI003EF6C24C